MSVWVFSCSLLARGERYFDSHVAPYFLEERQGVLQGACRVKLPEVGMALIPDEGSVTGALLHLKEEALPALDYLFGFKPERAEASEFVRRIVTVTDEAGRSVSAYAYFLRACVLRQRFPTATHEEA